MSSSAPNAAASNGQAIPRRLFTPEQANAMLPLVRLITADIVNLTRELLERKQRLDLLTRDRSKRVGNFYDDELAHRQEELERDNLRLDAYVHELLALGVELKSAADGLIDFPTLIDGRPALLCWKLGEPEVMFWHDLESGFAGRQPLHIHACS